MEWMNQAIYRFALTVPTVLFLPLFIMAGCGSDPIQPERIPAIEEKNEPKDDPVEISTDERPSFTVGSDQAVNEDAGPQVVAGWATNISSGLTDATKQAVIFTITKNSNEALFAEAPSVSPEGILSYTSATHVHGSADISLTLSNENGETSDAQSFTIMVLPIDHPPVALGQSLFIEEEVPVTIILEGFDAGGDDLTFDIVDIPSSGTLHVLDMSGPATAAVVYTPTEGAYGTSFSFRVDDGKTFSSPATVDITVYRTNKRPLISIDDVIVTPPNAPGPGPFPTSITLDSDSDLLFRFSDAEATEGDGSARAPYYFRIEPTLWPLWDDDTPSFDWRTFDSNEIALDGVIVTPNFHNDDGGYIQWSSSVGLGHPILAGLQFRMNYAGEYRIEITVIDNGFLGRCPGALVMPDPSELETFGVNDYRRVIGREGDWLNGDPTRCIRETTAELYIHNTADDYDMVILTFEPGALAD